MSIADQQKFLASFDKKLQRKVASYRRMKANRQHHVFVVTSKAITKGIVDTLRKKLAGRKNAEKIISKILKKTNIHGVIKEVAVNTRRRIENDSVVVGRVTVDTPDRFVAFFSATKQDNGNFRNIYKQVYTSYNSILDAFAEKVSEISIEVAGESFGDKAKNYFALEHDEFEGIAESHVRDSIIESLKGVSGIEYQDVIAWLEASNIDLHIVRDTNSDRMLVTIGSKFANLDEALATKGRKRDLKELVAGANALIKEEEETILNLSGSPSFVDMKRKKLLKKVTDDFAKGTGVTVTLDENVRVRGKKTTAKQPVKKRKSTNITASGLVKGSGAALGNTQKRRVKKGVASSPLKLIGLINQKLPRTVAKNMGDPALNYRTGRFASSARVTDIATTQKGYPSIGYTYEKNPYSVFESTSGSRFSSVDRDPRILLDRSIREIAQELALGRFYTRRV
jgi:hypothetical protein